MKSLFNGTIQYLYKAFFPNVTLILDPEVGSFILPEKKKKKV